MTQSVAAGLGQRPRVGGRRQPLQREEGCSVLQLCSDSSVSPKGTFDPVKPGNLVLMCAGPRNRYTF